MHYFELAPAEKAEDGSLRSHPEKTATSARYLLNFLSCGVLHLHSALLFFSPYFRKVPWARLDPSDIPGLREHALPLLPCHPCDCIGATYSYQ